MADVDWVLPADFVVNDGTDPILQFDLSERITQRLEPLLIQVYGVGETPETGDGAVAVPVPKHLVGMNITEVRSRCSAKGSSGTTDIALRRDRAGTAQDVLSTLIQHGDAYAANSTSINTSYDDLAEDDLLIVDIDAVRTGMEGLWIMIYVEPVALKSLS